MIALTTWADVAYVLSGSVAVIGGFLAGAYVERKRK